ncbi:hypothetical protein AB6A40_010215 [Gnathostoma spinigerum]|uniref:CUT domain-containing protein n=1 Tax=Gnathostoma spinigerum TaxID=75299 RepID=A0ABD6EVX1_9BILA
MEPPAVTSCSQQHSLPASNNASGMEKMRRGLAGGTSSTISSSGYLQIDPSLSTFNSSVNRAFEELPENFLESISPQQAQPAAQHESPQLASLAPMSVAASTDAAYATLAPMSAPSSYGSSMKIEPIHDTLQHHNSSLHHSNHPNLLDKLSFGTGPAGLLSPLHTNRPDTSTLSGGLLSVHQNGGRTSDMLANLRRPLQYIKEEVDVPQEFKSLDSNSYLAQHQGSLLTEEQQQQELDRRLANAETPPAVSNVELASSFIATMIGEQPSVSPTPQHNVYQPQRQFRSSHESVEMNSADELETGTAGPSEEAVSSVEDISEPSRQEISAGRPRSSYSTKDTTDPLNAEIDDDIYIDTKDLCKRIAWELKQHSIPQAIFAERILCRYDFRLVKRLAV